MTTETYTRDTVNLSVKDLEKLVSKITSEMTSDIFNKIDELQVKLSYLIHENQFRSKNDLYEATENDDTLSSEDEEQDFLSSSSEKSGYKSAKKDDNEKNSQEYKRNRSIRGRNKFVVSNRIGNEDNPAKFGAALKRAWVHVRRVKIAPTDEDISSFFQRKYFEKHVDLESLPQRPSVRSMAFKVGTNPKLLTFYEG
ncbi:uncharacterized protein LOC135136630 [Zophobas morio]|uniref:uncharacterized protein LOC135136630 n=1 Tax=Zophobas morio TaxID=2755281 RepID=UPI0030839FB2